MSRDAAGNWIPLAPVVGGTVITSTWANNMMTSFGADVTESLDRSGRGGMLVPLRIASGTKLEPGYSWTAELSTGFYRPLGGFDMRTSIGGKDIFRWNANGAQISPDDGVTWEAVLTNGGASGQVPVDAGTVQGQTLRWDQDTDQQWKATSVLTTDVANSRVGIGTATPLKALDVALADNPTIRMTSLKNGTWTDGEPYASLEFYSSDTSGTSGAAVRASIQALSNGTFGAETDIVFNSIRTSSGLIAEKMRIDAAGNVGIGTVAPAWKLVVESDNSVPILAKNTGGTLAAISFQGSTTSSDLRVRMGAEGEHAVFLTSGTEQMRIESTGRVGIGRTLPATALDVRHNVVSGSYSTVIPAAGGVPVLGTDFADLYNTDATILDGFTSLAMGVPGNTGGAFGRFILGNEGAGNGFFAFQLRSAAAVNDTTERMRITSDGNVGIGTAAPGTLLDMRKDAASVVLNMVSSTTGTTSLWMGDTGSQGLSRVSHDNVDNAMYFSTLLVERMRINSAGNLLVGHTTDRGAGRTLQAQGAVDGSAPIVAIKTSSLNGAGQHFFQAYISSGTVGNGAIVGAGASALAFAAFSDARIKTNIQPLSGELANIMALKPCSFDFTDREGGNTGFIAQEMQTVYSDCVHEDPETELLMIAGWSRTEARMVKAIQELTARVEALGG